MDNSRGGGRDGTPSGKFSTFSNGGNQRTERPRVNAVGRWSYVLQDVPEKMRSIFCNVNFGYAVRLTAVTCAFSGISFLLYQAIFVRSQSDLPLAARSRFAPAVPVTLLSKERLGGGDVLLLRFALPRAADYCGYAPVSSVRLTVPNSFSTSPLASLLGVGRLSRWYTPTSHPQCRGVVEFAVRDRDPGRMAARLRRLERGDRVWLGRWMREFPYTKNTYGELGLICSTSGASIALQMMSILDADKTDNTKLHFLYCHRTAKDIPFRDVFDKYTARNSNRIFIKYNVMSLAQQKQEDGVYLGENVFLGHIDPSIVKKALPPPVVLDPETGNAIRPKILICGPQSMLLPLCGRVSTVGNYTYWQGPFYKFSGFLKDMGYTQSQVYKFGVSTHMAVRQ
ncbi:putative NADH-cytochrome b5 reductase [Trypanosoma theileri]|uniref:Putative NADH-cytochrome b5 reductase n=1 Tax=Trypanosoma theileri TaxID=67003 RepID=A0A1X0NWV9_9TRYP|nr:putative NADH-cytochrome b5 reductase [Trypanosoma theileri]ORC88590.1 putative NADH-cytochrome b5 reductase [Trypanosoma theileri]